MQWFMPVVLPQRVLSSFLSLTAQFIVINPQGQYRFRKGDALFLIGETKPADL